MGEGSHKDDQHAEKLDDIQELEGDVGKTGAMEAKLHQADSACTSDLDDELTDGGYYGGMENATGSRHGQNLRDGIRSDGEVMRAWGELIGSATHDDHQHVSGEKLERTHLGNLNGFNDSGNGGSMHATGQVPPEHKHAGTYSEYSGMGLKSIGNSYNSYGAASKKVYASHARSIARPPPWDEAFAIPLGDVLRESRAIAGGSVKHNQRAGAASVRHVLGEYSDHVLQDDDAEKALGQHGSRGVEERRSHQNGTRGAPTYETDEIMMAKYALGGLGREGDVVVAVSVIGTRGVQGLRPAEDVDLFVCEYVHVCVMCVYVCMYMYLLMVYIVIVCAFF